MDGGLDFTEVVWLVLAKNSVANGLVEAFCLCIAPPECDTKAEAPIREMSMTLLLQSLQMAWVVDVGCFLIHAENFESDSHESLNELIRAAIIYWSSTKNT